MPCKHSTLCIRPIYSLSAQFFCATAADPKLAAFLRGGRLAAHLTCATMRLTWIGCLTAGGVSALPTGYHGLCRPRFGSSAELADAEVATVAVVHFCVVYPFGPHVLVLDFGHSHSLQSCCPWYMLPQLPHFTKVDTNDVASIFFTRATCAK